MIGPPLGGFITTYSSWRWIFYLNLPLGLVGIALAWRFIHASGDSERRPFDSIGFVLCGVSGTAVMYAMELLGRSDTPWREASRSLQAESRPAPPRSFMCAARGIRSSNWPRFA